MITAPPVTAPPTLAEIAHRALAPIDRPSGLGHITLT